MNKQDVEDFRQEFAICMFLGKYTPSEINSYRKVCIRRMDAARYTKEYRQHELLLEYKELIELQPPAFNEELLFSVLEKVANITKNQKMVILEFLKCGNLVMVAKRLGKDYNTTKAHYRAGIKSLQELTKELI